MITKQYPGIAYAHVTEVGGESVDLGMVKEIIIQEENWLKEEFGVTASSPRKTVH